MEIYKDLSNPASKEFEKLLNSQFTKNKNLEEGKIIDCVVSKVTDKVIYLNAPGLKQEPIIDISDLRSAGMLDKAVVGSTISVLLERIEHPKTGEIVVSASKAAKIKGWGRLLEAYEKNEPIMGKITGRVKGGCIVEHIDSGSLMFLPGSQISDSPLKDISHLMGEVQKFKLIKMDKTRGNACVSRKEVLSSSNKEAKLKLIDQFNIGDVIKGVKVKSTSSFGCFMSVNGELDVLCHLQEISYSRITHPDEFFSVGDTYDVLVISKDLTKLQIGVSLKQMQPDPFLEIDKYKVGSDYNVKIVKIMDFGAFAEIQPGLSALIHNSQLSFTKRNASAKKILKVGQEVIARISEIDKEKKRVALSIRDTKENPFVTFEKNHGVNSEITGEVVSKNQYALFLKTDAIDCEIFVHAVDLSWKSNAEEELEKYQIGDKLKIKIVEIQIDEQKIRGSARLLTPDPFGFLKGKKVNDIISTRVISVDPKSITVRPVDSELNFVIKKSQLAMKPEDQRSSRWTGNELVDVAIADFDFKNRKCVLSIKLLEEINHKFVMDKYGSSDSGKSLPFSKLDQVISKASEDKKKKKKE